MKTERKAAALSSTSSAVGTLMLTRRDRRILNIWADASCILQFFNNTSKYYQLHDLEDHA